MSSQAAAEVGGFAISEELKLAQEFLATLASERAPWADLYAQWAREQGLTADETRTVKAAVPRVRMYSTMERTARRRR